MLARYSSLLCRAARQGQALICRFAIPQNRCLGQPSNPLSLRNPTEADAIGTHPGVIGCDLPEAVTSTQVEELQKSAEPGECAAFVYSDPSTVVRSLYALAYAPLRVTEKAERAHVLVRGLRRGPTPRQRQLAVDLANICSHRHDEAEFNGLLLDLADSAAETDFYSVHVARDLVTRSPMSLHAIFNFFGGRAREVLPEVKPLDVLYVPAWKPTGMPDSAHAFLALLCQRRGPLYRNRDYVRVHKEEREHFLWVAEQVRELAPEFFRQYCVAREKEQVTDKRLTWQADEFLVCISERLFLLALIDVLPELLHRQTLLDAAGSCTQRFRFARDFRWAPPPLAAVAQAFGLDPRRRRRHQDLENKFLAWQRSKLWSRKRVKTLSSDLLPSIELLGQFALTLPLRHRPFASLLGELYAAEDTLLRPWYAEQVHPEDLVLHVLWSAELVRELSGYVARAMQASMAHHADVKNIAPPTVLCIGSGAAHLRHYLQHVLDKLVSADIRVAAAVPAVPRNGPPSPDYVPTMWQTQMVTYDELPQPAESRLLLHQVLEAYSPQFVICSCMPPKVDWSRSFRMCPTVTEYVLVGPKNSDSSGDARLTWGCATPFRMKGRAPAAPYYVRDGFIRKDLENLSLLCVGTDDAPGFEGANAVVSFRRLLKPQLSYSSQTGTSGLLRLPFLGPSTNPGKRINPLQHVQT